MGLALTAVGDCAESGTDRNMKANAQASATTMESILVKGEGISPPHFCGKVSSGL
jgi:hypothetical protein